MPALRIGNHFDLNWKYEVEKSLEVHLGHLLEHHRKVWPTILDDDMNFFDTALPLLAPPATNAAESEWHAYDNACEEFAEEWDGERFRVDYEIPYFHITSLFVHICSSIEGWCSSLCDLLVHYHKTAKTRKECTNDWALCSHLEFLRNVLHLDIKFEESLLQPLRCQFTVRNIFVHKPPLFHFSPAWTNVPHPDSGNLRGSGALQKSRDGQLRLDEKYVLSSLDRGIKFSNLIRQSI